MFEGQNEPKDIFSDVDKAAPPAPPRPAGAASPPTGPASRSAGEPVLRRGPSKLLLVGIIVIAAVIVGGGIYLFTRGGAAPVQPVQNTPIHPAVTNENPGSNANEASVFSNANEPAPALNVNGETNANANVNVNAPALEQPLAQDTDGDGLTDEEEATYGTDPNVADTDGDGLTDKDEVKLYGTDPKNPDTDGDTYPDGAEVSSGYDPKGPGRLFTVPH